MRVKKPWLTEPDLKRFRHAGLTCVLRRHSESGHWCGYVRIPKKHPLHRVEHEDQPVKFEVHGGVTFSGVFGLVGFPWAYGFDCDHYADLTPQSARLGGVYRTVEYAEQECRKLAEQIAKVRVCSECGQLTMKEGKSK